VKELRKTAFNGWICLGTAWKRRETLTNKEVLGPEPLEGGEYFWIYMGKPSFDVFLVRNACQERMIVFAAT